jgi:hypothetical protein
MVIAMVLFTLFKQFDNRGVAGANAIGYSDFLEEVRSNRIKSATISESPGGTEILAVTVDDRRIKTTATYLDRGLVGDLISSGIKFDVKPREEGSLLMTLLVSWGPMLVVMKPKKKSKRWSTSSRILNVSRNWAVEFLVVCSWWGPLEQVKLCWPKASQVKPKYRSSAFPVLILSKCLWVWALPVFVTCLKTPKRTHLASFSLTKSMRSVASVAQAWAVATTSASKPSTRCWSRWMALKPIWV